VRRVCSDKPCRGRYGSELWRTDQGFFETRMKDEIDAYAARFGALADKIWREEYFHEQSVLDAVA